MGLRKKTSGKKKRFRYEKHQKKWRQHTFHSTFPVGFSAFGSSSPLITPRATVAPSAKRPTEMMPQKPDARVVKPTDRLAALLKELASLVEDHDNARALKKILAKYQNKDGAAVAVGAGAGAGEDNNNSDFWDVSNSIDDLEEEEAGALVVALDDEA